MKNHDLTERSTRRRSVVARPALLVTLAVLTAGSVVGCGSSGDPFAEFAGTWGIDFGTGATSDSSFFLTCPVITGESQPIFLWDRDTIVLELGTLSDLVETSARFDCQLPFDVTGKTASVPASNPTTMAATECGVPVDSGTLPNPATGADDFHILLFHLKPSPWIFSLLAPVKGAAPPAQLAGTAVGALEDRDLTAGTTQNIDTCTYTVNLKLNKISK